MNEKVVLDTNILVSALWSAQGNPFQIIDYLISGQLIVYYSLAIMREYRQVLTRPRFKFSKAEVERILQMIERHGIEVSVEKSALPLPDESDRIFYDVAKASSAYLITGNTKHYPVAPMIMTPAAFLALFEKS